MKKRIIALLLCICLVGSMTVYAAGNEPDPTISSANIAEDYETQIEESEDTSEPVVSDDGTLQIEGNLPEDAVVERVESEDETAIELIESLELHSADYFNHIAVHDISILSDDKKWQPDEDVTVTLDNVKFDEGEKVEVYHILDDPDAIARAIEDGTANTYIDSHGNPVYYVVMTSENGDVVINANGSVSFSTDSFSIFIVKGFNDETNKVSLTKGDTIIMKRDEVKYFKWEYEGSTGAPSRGTWTIEDGEDYLNLEVFNSELQRIPNSNYATTYIYQYYWLKLTAVKPTPAGSKAEIQFEYPVLNADNKTYHREQERFFVEIVETDAELYIDNQVPANGCLVPVFNNSANKPENVEYVWSRSDGVTIKTEALIAPSAVVEGAVNVGIDRGGIDDNGTSNPSLKTYTVTAKKRDTGEIIATASHTVMYGNELLNGSFEYPTAHSVTHDYPNGAVGLFWKTTSRSVREQEVCQDIEIISNQYNQVSLLLTYGLTKLNSDVTFDGQNKLDCKYDSKLGIIEEDSPVIPDPDFPHGNQVAELNCDAPGALYQDVLTAPGAELYWEFFHRARNYQGTTASVGGYWIPDGFSYTVKDEETGVETTITDQKDYMYVIIAPTAQVEHITTQDQLNILINNAKDSSGNYHNGEYTTTVDDVSITYSIWELADDHTKWGYHNNNDSPYIVEDGAYLTRYFFAAGDNCNDRYLVGIGGEANHSGGNFIDAVSFSDDMPYRIEYYLNGTLVSELTETGKIEGGPDLNATVSAKNTNSTILNNKFLLQSMINDIDNEGKTVMNGVYSKHNVLKLYYVDYGVKVDKKVEIEGYDLLSAEDKAVVNAKMSGYAPTFTLYQIDAQGKETAISEVDVPISVETMTGTAEFKTSTNDPVLPEEGFTYKIVETNVPVVNGLSLTQQAADSKVFSPAEDGVFISHSAENKYEIYSNLTINKSGTSDSNQASLFRIQGKAGTKTAGIDLTVSVHENGSLKVTYLPLGDYTITEITAWSWRYSLGEASTVIDDSAVFNSTNRTIDFTLTVLDETANFTNSRLKQLWLSGEYFIRNLFNQVITTQPIAPSSPVGPIN